MLIGELKLVAFPASATPTGWLPCDGTAYNISAYPGLFAVIGTAYGGDGITTFAVPNTLGRVAVGAGSGAGLTTRTLGETDGSEVIAAPPNHTHSVSVGVEVSTNVTGNVNVPTTTNNTLSGSPTGVNGAAAIWSESTPSIQLAGVTASIGSAGGGDTIEIMPPMFVGTWLIATVSG